VYQVGELGLLVHNAYNALRTAMIKAFGDDYMKGFHAAHIIPQNGWAWAPNELFTIIARVRNAGLMDDLANGFRAGAGHAGTHTKAYVEQVIDVMIDRTTPEKILEGLDMLRKRIDAGDF
jgi:hypothetical protein